AWRLPAFAFAGLLSYWLCLLGLSRSRAAGVLAPLLFWCSERTFFHGHLACFDVPICAMWAGVGVAWLRGTGPRLAATYGLALAAMVLPLPTVALLAAAGISLLAGFARRRLESQRLLELGLAGAALLPFLLRTTPIFGGIKHWLAFVALLAPEAASLMARVAPQPRLLASAAIATFAAGIWQIAHVHPYGTSAYGELSGGIPGAATLGMQR